MLIWATNKELFAAGRKLHQEMIEEKGIDKLICLYIHDDEIGEIIIYCPNQKATDQFKHEFLKETGII